MVTLIQSQKSQNLFQFGLEKNIWAYLTNLFYVNNIKKSQRKLISI